MHPSLAIYVPPVVAAVILACAVAGFAQEARQVEIAVELSRLAAAHGFSVTGDEHLEDGIGRAEDGEPLRRVRVLLEDFDHIIVQDGRGGIERVIVLGAAAPGTAPETPVVAVDGAPPPDAPIVLPTIRKGSQHSVQVSLEGADGKRSARVLLIDTGADTVVLPASLIKELGIDAAGLEAREVQTANGRAKARVGELPALWLGTQRVTGVAVAFLEDDKLGTLGLLGMSVLGRYRMTIDDQGNRLTLTSR